MLLRVETVAAGKIEKSTFLGTWMLRSVVQTGGDYREEHFMDAIEKQTVVVTGASSGIGRACVSRMIQSGWRVFATVRKVEDRDKLLSEGHADLIPVIVEITDRDSIIRAADQVTAQLQNRGLEGLVNVAGIGMVRPLAYATAADLREIFDINVFGQIAVTQAFLPLLHRARGRIVNISSVGAHIAIPFASLLNASKSAFGSFSDALRLELRPFGVRVCTVEPGAIKTPAVEKTLGNIETVVNALPARGAAQYGKMLSSVVSRAHKREMNGSPPEVVARAVHHALTARRPRIRYLVGKDARFLATLPRILPDWLLDAFLLRAMGLPSKLGAAVAAGS
jgi:NAD(P)-dependent dehydrogenase (short-subunit alcohol dehydrogenase family)